MDYDAQDDGVKSYLAAYEAKRARGDHLYKVVIGDAQLYNADCLTVIKSLPSNSIDSTVTDPPYELGFMGKAWDNTGIANSVELWAEVLRVLKPGGHVVAFSGTRTQHRMVCAIEDAGFEIRDQLGWLYGSGFPKSHDVGNGWGTALKPAWEPICLARKAFKGTVAANVEKHGTGAINIDGCRVETTAADKERMALAATFGSAKKSEGWDRPWMDNSSEVERRIKAAGDRAGILGRFPANVIHDGSDEVIAAFPVTKSGKPGVMRGGVNTGTAYGAESRKPGTLMTGFGDEGSAARFFYCAKASRKDRDEGLVAGEDNRANTHPTVKPTSLMQYLCRLVTPPGGVILDPFLGSGSTGKAAIMEGFSFIGCEREAEYMPIAEARIRYAVDKMAEEPEQRSFI